MSSTAAVSSAVRIRRRLPIGRGADVGASKASQNTRSIPLRLGLRGPSLPGRSGYGADSEREGGRRRQQPGAALDGGAARVRQIALCRQ